MRAWNELQIVNLSWGFNWSSERQRCSKWDKCSAATCLSVGWWKWKFCESLSIFNLTTNLLSPCRCGTAASYACKSLSVAFSSLSPDERWAGCEKQMEMKATNEIVNRMNLNIHEPSSGREFRENLKLKIAREMIFTVLMQDVWCGSEARTERIFLIFHRAGLKGSWRSCCAQLHRVFISTHKNHPPTTRSQCSTFFT